MADILLLETDRQLARTIKDFFGQAGHKLSYYSDPQAAVMSADKSRPHAIIVNLFLASRSGVEFLYELRSYPEWQGIPIIVTGRLSQNELVAFAGSFKELNVAAYIPKQTASLQELLTQTEKTLQPAAV